MTKVRHLPFFDKKSGIRALTNICSYCIMVLVELYPLVEKSQRKSWLAVIGANVCNRSALIGHTANKEKFASKDRVKRFFGRTIFCTMCGFIRSKIYRYPRVKNSAIDVSILPSAKANVGLFCDTIFSIARILYHTLLRNSFR